MRPVSGFLDSWPANIQNGSQKGGRPLIGMREELKNGIGVMAGVFAAAVLVMVPLLAMPQSQTEPGPTMKTEKQTKPIMNKAPRFTDVTVIRASDAARQAARDAAGKKQGKTPSSETAKPDPVMELHDAPSSSAPASAQPEVGKESAKAGGLKSLHGEVYGATGSGARVEGAAAGMSTKGGKINVYIDTQHSASSTSVPR